MPRLTPNDPQKRLQYVLKQYWDKNPYAVLNTLWVSLFLLGREDYRGAPGSESARSMVLSISHKLGDGIVRGDVDIVKMAREDTEALIATLPQRHAYDFVIPWFAKEFAREIKEREGRGRFVGSLTETQWTSRFAEMRDELERHGTVIAQWAQAEHVDIMRLGYDEVVERAGAWFREHKEERDVPQGEVVYKFKDGYTIQKLTAPEQLKLEGDVMGHCVGSYCEAVSTGRSVIYSLRDKKGRPHVTIEWQPLSTSELSRLSATEFEERVPGKFVQIHGKQNEPPADKYRPYLIEWLQEGFPSDVTGLQLLTPSGSKESWPWITITDRLVVLRAAMLEGFRFEGCEIRIGPGRSVLKRTVVEATSISPLSDDSPERATPGLAVSGACTLQDVELLIGELHVDTHTAEPNRLQSCSIRVSRLFAERSAFFVGEEPAVFEDCTFRDTGGVSSGAAKFGSDRARRRRDARHPVYRNECASAGTRRASAFGERNDW